MTGDCHVRFCERLRGETPLCLLGATFFSLAKLVQPAKAGCVNIHAFCIPQVYLPPAGFT